MHAVESYEILPDADTWANAYDLFKFSERPGDRNPEVCCNLSPYTDEHPPRKILKFRASPLL